MRLNSSRPFVSRVPIALFLALALVAAKPATAANFAVNPIQLYLTASESSTLVTVANQSPEKVRFQITGYVWDQSPSGEMKLTPTDDLVFFPTLFTLDPGEQRRIRIGSTATVGEVEKSFRIFVQELPPLEGILAPSRGAQIVLRTKIGIPVFLKPPAPALVGAEVRNAEVHKGTLSFDVGNTGNVHFMTQGVHVAARSHTGAKVFEENLSGWYVLPGGHRTFDVRLPKAACNEAREISIDLKAEDKHFSKKFEHQPGDCGP